MNINDEPTSYIDALGQSVQELEDLENKENKTDDDLAKQLDEISIRQKTIYDELKEMKEQLSVIPKHLVKNFVEKTVQASELNKLVRDYYDAFRDSPKDDPVKFECLELLAYMGIIIYPEKDFVPYVDDNSDDDVENYEIYI